MSDSTLPEIWDTKGLQQSGEYLLKENNLVSLRTAHLWCVSFPYSHFPPMPPQFYSCLKNQQLAIIVETSRLAVTERDGTEQDWNSLKALLPENCHYLTWLISSTCQDAFVWPVSEYVQCEKHFPQSCMSKQLESIV